MSWGLRGLSGRCQLAEAEAMQLNKLTSMTLTVYLTRTLQLSHVHAAAACTHPAAFSTASFAT
jgi:hypothetical protein